MTEESNTNRVNIIKQVHQYGGAYYDVDIRSKNVDVEKLRDLVLDTYKKLEEKDAKN